MNARSSARRFALALALLALPPAAMANQCGDVSPLLQQLGDRYYELEELSKSESIAYAVQPNKVIETVRSESYKAGEGTRTRCFGASVLRSETRTFVLESIDTSRVNSFNEVVVDALEYNADTKAAHHETVFIPLARQYITLKGENGFVVNSRHRQPIAGNSRRVHLREISIEAFGSHEGVEIMQSIYVNGHLAEWFTWKLKS